MADDADIIPGSYILQYGYHFGVVIIKLVFGPSFFFSLRGFRQTDVIVVMWRIVRVLFLSQGERLLCRPLLVLDTG